MKEGLLFKQIKRSHLYEEVADQIKEAIYDGRLKPGDRLPSERELCQMFGVGRPTIREAMRILSIMGLTEVNAGIKGSLVKDVDITQYLDAVREQLSWLIRVSDETIIELWEVRKYIDLGIAHAVARAATPESFEILDELIEEMRAVQDDIYAYFPLAVEFHRQLALASKSKVFYLIWVIFDDILLKGYSQMLDKIFPSGPARLFEANQMVLEAIKLKDSAAIDRAMDFHAQQEKYIPRAYAMEERRD